MARIKVEKGISRDESTGKYYVLQCGGTDPRTGKQLKRYSVVGTLAEARAIRKTHTAEVKAKKAKGEDYRLNKRQNMTVSEAVEQYLTVWRDDLAETSQYEYRKMLTRNWLPWCHENNIKHIKSITPMDIKQYMIWLKDTKQLGANTVSKHYSLLKTYFEMAWMNDIIKENIVAKVKPGKRVDVENHCYTVAEAAELLEYAKGDRVEIALLLAIYMGLRREEVAGLKWANVHLEGKTPYLEIKQARLRAGTNIVEKCPKTPTSARYLYIPERVKDCLVKMKAEQEENKAQLGTEYIDTDYVAVWDNGAPLRPDFIYDHYKILQRKCGLRTLKFHDLRKTFSTTALMDMQEIHVQHALGHKAQNVTEASYIVQLDMYNEKVIKKVANRIDKEIEKRGQRKKKEAA